jgi:hypothetical protein
MVVVLLLGLMIMWLHEKLHIVSRNIENVIIELSHEHLQILLVLNNVHTYGVEKRYQKQILMVVNVSNE